MLAIKPFAAALGAEVCDVKLARSPITRSLLSNASITNMRYCCSASRR